MRRYAVLIAVLLLPALLSGQQLHEFDWAASQVKSPDGQHTISWSVSACSGDGCCGPGNRFACSGQLVFADSSERVILRPIIPPAVGWSPDSKWFFVNDRQGSSFATSYLFAIDRIPRRADLFDLVSRQLTPSERSGHVYVSSLRWLNPNEILVRVYGHTDEAPVREFVNCFVVEIHGNVTKAEAERCR